MHPRHPHLHRRGMDAHTATTETDVHPCDTGGVHVSAASWRIKVADLVSSLMRIFPNNGPRCA
eukprot:2855-Eustigmatos_ZCMA.PRE.1